MKKITLFFLVLLVSVAVQSQTILGGGGTCHVNADPNTIAAIAAQNQSACKQAINTITGQLWLYDDTQAAGAKWVLDSRTRNFSRALPNVVNSAVNIGTYNLATTSFATFKINLSCALINLSKNYIITMAPFNGVNLNYTKINPIMSSQADVSGNYELLIRNPTALQTEFSVVFTSGTLSGQIYITIEQLGNVGTFTPSSTVTAGISYPNTYWQYGNSMANIRTYISSFTAAFDDDTIICNSTSFVVGTIPAPTTCLGKQLTLVNLGTGQLLVSPAYRINSTTMSSSVSAGNRITVQSDGTDWIQIR